MAAECAFMAEESGLNYECGSKADRILVSPLLRNERYIRRCEGG
jgi:hypothetical protein